MRSGHHKEKPSGSSSSHHQSNLFFFVSRDYFSLFDRVVRGTWMISLFSWSNLGAMTVPTSPKRFSPCTLRTLIGSSKTSNDACKDIILVSFFFSGNFLCLINC